MTRLGWKLVKGETEIDDFYDLDLGNGMGYSLGRTGPNGGLVLTEEHFDALKSVQLASFSPELSDDQVVHIAGSIASFRLAKISVEYDRLADEVLNTEIEKSDA